jgi:hypothetical protein
MTEQEFWDILFDVPETKPVFFRLYYDSKGRPLFYSMEDLPGTYIEIDADAYARSSMQVRVRDGKIVQVSCRAAEKLTPSDRGTSCHIQDIAVISDSDNSIKWTKKTYEED